MLLCHRIYHVFVAAMIVLLLSAPLEVSSRETLPRFPDESENKDLRVAFFELDGFNVIDEQNYRTGYGYEYLEEISKYTNWNYTYVTKVDERDSKGKLTGRKKDLTLDEAIRMVAEGELDLIGSLKRTPEREELLAFPEYASGEQYRMLTVLDTDNRYEYGVFSTFEGMRIGMVQGSESNKELDPFCRKNEFTNYSKYYYHTYADLRLALKERKIDAIFTSNLRRGDHEQAVAILSPFPQYFATTKGNEKVLNGLNYALGRITVQKPGFEVKLYQKYYGDSSLLDFQMSEEEQDYIKSCGTITVSVDNQSPPFGYLNSDGEISGVAVDVMEYVKKLTGLNVNYVLADAQADVRLLKFCDTIWNQKNRMKVTSPCINDSISAVSHKDVKNYDKKTLRVALVDQTYIGEKYIKLKEYQNQVLRATMLECIRAVNDGEADVTFVPSYVANCAQRKGLMQNCNNSIVQGTELEYGLGISDTGDGKLFMILNRAIESIPDGYIQNSLNRQLSYYSDNQSLIEWMQQNSLQSIFIISAVISLLIITVSLQQIHKNKLLRERDMRIQEAVFQQNMLQKLSEMDGLTGISNKVYFQKEVERMLKEQKNKIYMLLFLDIDNFKKMNDQFGHLAGDEVLKQVAKVLHQHFDSTGLAGRFGGDEFYAFAAVKTAEEARRQAEAVREEFTHLWPEKGYEISISVGIVLSPRDGTDFDTLIQKADDALYRAKQSGKDQIVSYSKLKNDK